jgi:hypothetical protein
MGINSEIPDVATVQTLGNDTQYNNSLTTKLGHLIAQ